MRTSQWIEWNDNHSHYCVELQQSISALFHIECRTGFEYREWRRWVTVSHVKSIHQIPWYNTWSSEPRTVVRVASSSDTCSAYYSPLPLCANTFASYDVFFFLERTTWTWACRVWYGCADKIHVLTFHTIPAIYFLVPEWSSNGRDESGGCVLECDPNGPRSCPLSDHLSMCGKNCESGWRANNMIQKRRDMPDFRIIASHLRAIEPMTTSPRIWINLGDWTFHNWHVT